MNNPCAGSSAAEEGTPVTRETEALMGAEGNRTGWESPRTSNGITQLLGAPTLDVAAPSESSLLGLRWGGR